VTTPSPRPTPSRTRPGRGSEPRPPVPPYGDGVRDGTSAHSERGTPSRPEGLPKVQPDAHRGVERCAARRLEATTDAERQGMHPHGRADLMRVTARRAVPPPIVERVRNAPSPDGHTLVLSGGRLTLGQVTVLR
jgi:hypothetical protein